MSFELTLAGAFALVFFISVDGARVEMMLAAGLAILAGALMMPMESHHLFDGDIEIGESTATRRLRK